MRKTAARYPDLNITTFEHKRFIADMNEIVSSTVIQNCAIELFCIGLIGFIFIPKFICTVWIILAIISIDIGKLDLHLYLSSSLLFLRSEQVHVSIIELH